MAFPNPFQRREQEKSHCSADSERQWKQRQPIRRVNGAGRHAVPESTVSASTLTRLADEFATGAEQQQPQPRRGTERCQRDERLTQGDLDAKRIGVRFC